MSNVFIISAPSGSGKSTLVREVMQSDDGLLFSISYTTRAPRGQEKEGESYHYISHAEFEARIAKDEFLEWAKVFEKDYYGTHVSYWHRAKDQGKDLVLDIDVQGARQLRGKIPESISIFILPPSLETLRERLQARSEDPEEVIERRLREAVEEIKNYHEYDYVLVNRNVAPSAADLAAVFRAGRVRRSKMEGQIKPILATFLGSSRSDKERNGIS